MIFEVFDPSPLYSSVYKLQYFYIYIYCFITSFITLSFYTRLNSEVFLENEHEA